MPLNETARAYHKGCDDEKANATITRTPAGWVMHCFKCGAKGFTYARVAPLPGARVPTSGAPNPKPHLAPDPLVRGMKLHEEVLRRHNMTWYKYDGSDVAYDRSTDRLCFKLSAVDSMPGNPASIAMPVGWVGKSLNRSPKWLLSDNSKAPPPDRAYFYHAPSTSLVKTEMCVLVEDPISALKISYADTRVMAIAMLGLSVPPGLLEFLMTAPHDMTIVVWPDGDAPGINRGNKIAQQIQFIRPGTKFYYVADKDPKHLDLRELEDHLAGIRTEID